MNKKILAFILTFVLMFSFTACNSNTAKTGELKEVKIGFPSSGSGFPGGVHGVAIENGFFDEFLNPLGYKAVNEAFVGMAPAIHEALVGKSLDYVLYAGMSADLSKANGVDHTLISITMWVGSLWKLAVSTSSNINTIADLKGKKIAYTRGTSSHIYLLKVLNDGGIQFSDIIPLNTTIPDGMVALATGSVDAAVVLSGHEKQLEKEGKVKVIHVQFNADKSVFYEPSVFIARTDFHKKNPDVTVAIQKALLKSKDWMKEDPIRYYNLLSRKSMLPMEVVLETASLNIDALVTLNLDEVYIDSLKEILQFLNDNELTKGSIDFESWIDPTVIERALKEYESGK
jgi:sulfonate transport system substrate-binding protein